MFALPYNKDFGKSVPFKKDMNWDFELNYCIYL